MSYAEDSEFSGSYPSLGFVRLLDAELGNGDYSGLYWPYGREAREPVVVDTVHDEWALEPAFSSVGVFVDWLELNGGERGDEEVDDPGLVTLRFAAASKLFRDDPGEAVELLRGICEDFPESSTYWFALAGQLRRVGDREGSCRAALRAYCSNWAFGAPTDGVLRMLRGFAGLFDDPVLERSEQLTLGYGGVKENENYSLLRACIDEYLSAGTVVPGLLLNQNLGYMMAMETRAFQERHGFQDAAWLEEHVGLCETHLGDSRRHIG